MMMAIHGHEFACSRDLHITPRLLLGCHTKKEVVFFLSPSRFSFSAFLFLVSEMALDNSPSLTGYYRCTDILYHYHLALKNTRDTVQLQKILSEY